MLPLRRFCFVSRPVILPFFFFFFNDTATTEIYTLSLHDALPIRTWCHRTGWRRPTSTACSPRSDRKSTRLNSSHPSISYAVFCLKKKNAEHDVAELVRERVQDGGADPRLQVLLGDAGFGAPKNGRQDLLEALMRRLDGEVHQLHSQAFCDQTGVVEALCRRVPRRHP